VSFDSLLSLPEPCTLLPKLRNPSWTDDVIACSLLFPCAFAEHVGSEKSERATDGVKHFVNKLRKNCKHRPVGAGSLDNHRAENKPYDKTDARISACTSAGLLSDTRQEPSEGAVFESLK
jgi:hypothetical protein